jgi:DNA-binding beta-propeller fold protein YncE
MKSGHSGREAVNVQKPEGLVPEAILEGEIFGKRISQPWGIVSDEFANLYLVDGGNNRLLKFDNALQPVRETGGFGSAEGLLNSPTYIAVGNSLNLYVCDGGNQRISIYDTRLNYVGRIDYSDAEDLLKFGHPAGIAAGDYGEVWIADPDKSRIAVFNDFGNFDHFVGDVLSYSGLLSKPQDLARDKFGDFAVLDAGNLKIVVFSNSGVFRYEFDSDILAYPSALDIDKYGNFWIVDRNPASVLCFNKKGDLLFSIGTFGREGDYSFNQPHDLALLQKDRIVISDTGNDRLLIYRILYPQ